MLRIARRAWVPWAVGAGGGLAIGRRLNRIGRGAPIPCAEVCYRTGRTTDSPATCRRLRAGGSCGRGETGRRAGLKIRRGQPRAGSIPAARTKTTLLRSIWIAINRCWAFNSKSRRRRIWKPAICPRSLAKCKTLLRFSAADVCFWPRAYAAVTSAPAAQKPTASFFM